MPFLLVLYAPDRDAADNAMQKIAHLSTYDQYPPRVVGLYRFPSKTENECPGWRCPGFKGENVFGYGRHHTDGYIVHGACQRRPKGFRSKIKLALLGLLGINLLPRESTPAIFRNPQGHDYPEAFPPLADSG